MIVGLTGGIGSGKTTVGEMFVKLGMPVYNSDTRAKKLMESSQELIQNIKELLGEKAYSGTTLNRKYIADLIFKNENLLEAMNGIVHPEVRKDFLLWSKQQKSSYVIQESALIFEIGAQDFYDCIILVTAPIDLRIARVRDRDKSESEKKIRERMGNQLSDATKTTGSDYVIENIDIEHTRQEVLKIHRSLLENS